MADTVQVDAEEKKADCNYKAFELLYDKYSPKVFGYIVQHTDSIEMAEEFLINVFIRIWDDIKTFDEHTEKKVMRILLLVCKPIYINRTPIHS